MPRSPDFPKKKTIADLFADVRRPLPGADTAWYKFGPSEAHGIDYTNSWANVGGTLYAPGSWHMAEDGQARMRGRITGGEIGTLVAILPEEIRPEFTCYFPIDTDTPGEYDLSNVHFRTFVEPDNETDTDV